MLSHKNLWGALDKLAEQNGLSISALARKAGLNPTVFNPSKRKNNHRDHWPSMESFAAALNAVGCGLEDFAPLLNTTKTRPLSVIQTLTLAQASLPYAFDQTGRPSPSLVSEMAFTPFSKNDVVGIELDTNVFEPFYSDGTILVIAANEKPRRGDRVVAKTHKNEIHIKTLAREGAQKIDLAPLTPDDMPITLAQRDIQWIRRIIWASQ